MKIGTHEVIHVIARNAEMRRVFQGEDKIYELPEPDVQETDDYLSNRCVNKYPLIGAWTGLNLPETDYYPAYESELEFTIKCRFKLLDVVDTALKKCYTINNGDIVHTNNEANNTYLYRPGVISLCGTYIPKVGQSYVYKSTYCAYNLWALLIDSSTHKLRTSSGFERVQSTYGQSENQIYESFKINNQSYSDSSVGFVEFNVGAIDGTDIFIRTFCPSQNEYHTFKGYVEISEDSSNYIIEPHLEIDDVDNYNTYLIDKEIDITDFIQSKSEFGLKRTFNIPIVHANFDSSHNMIMHFGGRSLTGLSEGEEYYGDDTFGYFNFDTRIDYAYVDLKQHYNYSGYNNPYQTYDDNPNDFPSYLGTITYNLVPTKYTYQYYDASTDSYPYATGLSMRDDEGTADYTIVVDASTSWELRRFCYPSTMADIIGSKKREIVFWEEYPYYPPIYYYIQEN